jgi:uncharacterized protein YdeI (YjbR/CyaY-like superfamily)
MLPFRGFRGAGERVDYGNRRMPVDITKTLYIKNRKEWRRWLEKNFQTAREIWLVFPHKSSGRQRIPYNDAVEEALCFGWIDSIVKKHDDESSMQRFTPRNPRSGYSQPNRERLRLLLDEGRVHPSVRETAERLVAEEFVFPDDIMDAIKSDPTAWKNFQSFSGAYKRIRVAYIDGARARPETFKARLENFIRKTRENRMIGYGGIEKYFAAD